ncbi:MAG: hypothetical protein EAX96_20985 [Candidatus Lokiarchaeota archaeon]|nr:hypothetical protein [Candidatus Lokiarchaeota archaeon]
MNFNLIIAKKIGTLLKEEDFIPHFPLCSKNKEKNVFINNIDAYWTPVGPITRVSFIINVCNEDNTQKSLFIMHDAGEENNISPKFSVDSQKFGNITIHKNFTRAFNLRRKPNYEISFFLLSSNNKTIIPNSEYKISISLNKTKTDIAVGVGKQVFKVLVKLIK